MKYVLNLALSCAQKVSLSLLLVPAPGPLNHNTANFWFSTIAFKSVNMYEITILIFRIAGFDCDLELMSSGRLDSSMFSL